MGVIPDRQDFLRRLTQGGAYTDMQASVLADALDATVGQPASKVDLLETRAELKQDIGEVRAELKDVRAELKQNIGDLRTETRKEFGDVRREIGDLRLEVRVLSERVERIADRTLIRVSAVMIFLLTAFFGAAFKLATSVWPPPP